MFAHKITIMEVSVSYEILCTCCGGDIGDCNCGEITNKIKKQLERDIKKCKDFKEI